MLKDKNMQLSFYSLLYFKIPENNTLKLIKDSVDFSFINQLLEDSYCKYYGRPAKEPELMIKLLVLQYLYNLSDVRVIEDASLNLAYMYFLDINPEEAYKQGDGSCVSKHKNRPPVTTPVTIIRFHYDHYKCFLICVST